MWYGVSFHEPPPIPILPYMIMGKFKEELIHNVNSKYEEITPYINLSSKAFWRIYFGVLYH